MNPNSKVKKKILKDILFCIFYIGWCLTVLVHADDNASSDEAANTNKEREKEAAKFDDPNDPFRSKRQHGHGEQKPLGGVLSSVLNKKLGMFGSLSSISSFNSAAGKHAPTDHGYEYATSVHKPVDWYSLKKNIKASLLQAVKAITGGVILLNGQLVKVNGHLLTAGGHLLSTKGNKITSFGGNLATQAFPSHHHIHESVPSEPTASGYEISGPGVAHKLETGFPSHQQYPSGYYKNEIGYAKRATSGPGAETNRTSTVEVTI